MLFLTRKTGQAIIVNDDIEINVIEITAKTVKLGFKFPPTQKILRQELYEKLKKENQAAALNIDFFNKFDPKILNEKLNETLSSTLTQQKSFFHQSFKGEKPHEDGDFD